MNKAPGNSVRLFVTNVVTSVGSRVLQLTVLVWANQHLIHRVAPDEYSLFPIVVSLMFFAEIFKNIVTGGIARFIVEADSKGDDTGVTRIVSSMFPIVLVAAALFAFAGGIAVWQVEKILNITPEYLVQVRLMLVLLTTLLCVTVASAPFTEGAYIRQHFVTLNIVDLICEAIRVLLLVILLFGVSTKVIWLVVASTAAGIVHILIRIALTRRWIPAIHFRKELFSMKTAWPLIRFGGWTSIQGITGLVSSTAPVLLLNRFGTAVDVAAFYLGRLPDIQIRGLAAVAIGPAQPALIRMFATKGSDLFTELYYRGGRYNLWMVLFIVAPLLMFAREIIHLYAGAEYAVAATVMFSLLAVYPFLFASGMFFQVALAIGKIGAYYICDIVIQSATLLALLYAVAYRGLGAPGAAMAIALVGGGLHVLLIWPMGLRLVKGQWNRFLRHTFLPGMLPFLSACLACYIFKAYFEMNSWLMIVAGSAVGLVVYLVVLLRFCLDALDRNLVFQFLQKIRETAKGRVVMPVETNA